MCVPQSINKILLILGRGKIGDKVNLPIGDTVITLLDRDCRSLRETVALQPMGCVEEIKLGSNICNLAAKIQNIRISIHQKNDPTSND
jgi:hypothetical protein